MVTQEQHLSVKPPVVVVNVEIHIVVVVIVIVGDTESSLMCISRCVYHYRDRGLYSRKPAMTRMLL